MYLGLKLAGRPAGMPRTVLGIAAGLLFGMVWGFVWAIVGAMMGAAAGFAFVRWMGAAGTLDVTPGIGRLVERAGHGGRRTGAIHRLATPHPRRANKHVVPAHPYIGDYS